MLNSFAIIFADKQICLNLVLLRFDPLNYVGLELRLRLGLASVLQENVATEHKIIFITYCPYYDKAKVLGKDFMKKILPLSLNNSAKEKFVIFLYRNSFSSLRWKYYLIFCGNSGGGVALKPTTRSSHWIWLTQNSLTNRILSLSYLLIWLVCVNIYKSSNALKIRMI